VTVRRFDVTTRLVHWAIALLTLVLLVTGSILYVGQLEAAIGRRAQLASIHVWCGVLLPVPLVLAVLLRRAGAGVRADVHELSWWPTGSGCGGRRAVRRRASSTEDRSW
jgi:formate dehydrogenase subunit gamma